MYNIYNLDLWVIQKEEVVGGGVYNNNVIVVGKKAVWFTDRPPWQFLISSGFIMYHCP